MRDTDLKSPTVRSGGESLWPPMPRSRENPRRATRGNGLHARCGALHMTPVTRARGFLKRERRERGVKTVCPAARDLWKFRVRHPVWKLPIPKCNNLSFGCNRPHQAGALPYCGADAFWDLPKFNRPNQQLSGSRAVSPSHSVLTQFSQLGSPPHHADRLARRLTLGTIATLASASPTAQIPCFLINYRRAPVHINRERNSVLSVIESGLNPAASLLSSGKTRFSNTLFSNQTCFVQKTQRLSKTGRSQRNKSEPKSNFSCNRNSTLTMPRCQPQPLLIHFFSSSGTHF